MRPIIPRLEQFLFDSPTSKALIPALLAIGVGVLSGSLVTEITTPAGLAWAQAPRTISFFGLLALTIAQVWFSRMIYTREAEISKFADNEFCMAYIRSRCLPEVAEKYQERIRNGRGGELKQAMDELREVLK